MLSRRTPLGNQKLQKERAVRNVREWKGLRQPAARQTRRQGQASQAGLRRKDPPRKNLKPMIV